MQKNKALDAFNALIKTAEKGFENLPESAFVASQILIVRNVEGLPFRDYNHVPATTLRDDLLRLLESQSVLEKWHFVPSEKLCKNNYARVAELHLFDDKGTPEIIIEPATKPTIAIYVNARDNLQFVACGNENNAKTLILQYKKLAGTVDALDKTLHFAQTPTLGYLTSSPEMVGNAVSLQALLHLPALVMNDEMSRVVMACNAVGVRVRGLSLKDDESSGCYFTLETSRMLGTTPQELITKFSDLCETICTQEKKARQNLAEDDRLFLRVQDCYSQARFCSSFTLGQALNVMTLLKLGVEVGYLDAVLKTELEALLPKVLESAFPQNASPEERTAARATLINEILEGVPAPKRLKNK